MIIGYVESLNCKCVCVCSQVSRDELDWSANELRNCLRAIDWDLEDLSETISILSNKSMLSSSKPASSHDSDYF